MKSRKDMIDKHIRCFRERKMDGILDDFSPDAIIITPPGLLKGSREVQTPFHKLLTEFRKPNSSETVHTAILEDDYGYLEWRNARQLL